MSYLSTSPTPPRLAELWPAMRERLNTAAMAAVLGGLGRTYAAMDHYEDDEGGRDEAWGRVVVVPATRAFDVQEAPDRIRVPPVLVRAEVNDPGEGYDPTIPLEAAQDEAFKRLEGWRPAGLQRLGIMLPFFRRRPPEPLPIYDGGRGLYVSSSEYALVAGPATAA